MDGSAQPVPSVRPTKHIPGSDMNRHVLNCCSFTNCGHDIDSRCFKRQRQQLDTPICGQFGPHSFNPSQNITLQGSVDVGTQNGVSKGSFPAYISATYNGDSPTTYNHTPDFSSLPFSWKVSDGLYHEQPSPWTQVEIQRQASQMSSGLQGAYDQAISAHDLLWNPQDNLHGHLIQDLETANPVDRTVPFYGSTFGFNLDDINHDGDFMFESYPRHSAINQPQSRGSIGSMTLPIGSSPSEGDLYYHISPPTAPTLIEQGGTFSRTSYVRPTIPSQVAADIQMPVLPIPSSDLFSACLPSVPTMSFGNFADLYPRNEPAFTLNAPRGFEELYSYSSTHDISRPNASKPSSSEDGLVTQPSVSSISPQDLESQGLGKRFRRPMNRSQKLRRAIMRNLGACTRCKLMKVKCSPGLVCNRCKRIMPQSQSICIRLGHEKLTNRSDHFFFPVTSPKNPRSAARVLILEMVLSWTQHRIVVDIAHGLNLIPMHFELRMYIPAEDRMHSSPCFVVEGRRSAIDMRNSPPFALTESSTRALPQVCRKYVDNAVKAVQDCGELKTEHTPAVPWEIRKIIREYCVSTNDMLVYEALRIYEMQCILTTNFHLSKDSAARVQKFFPPCQWTEHNASLVSPITRKQINEELYKQIKEATGKIRKYLAERLDSKNSKYWASLFCIITVLSMCAEIVQVASDATMVYSILQENGDANLRDKSIKHCYQLDKFLITNFVQKFHDVMKSHQFKGSKKQQKGFNPLRDGPEGLDLDHATAALATKVRRVFQDNENEINERIKHQYFDYKSDLGELVANHMTLRERNSGRLVSIFLKSFFEYGINEGRQLVNQHCTDL